MTDGHVTQGSSTRFRTFVLLSIPALLVYPIGWVEDATRPPESIWYLAEKAGWIFLLTPLCLIAMIFRWRSFQAQTSAQRYVVLALMLFTLYVAVRSIPVFSMILGL